MKKRVRFSLLDAAIIVMVLVAGIGAYWFLTLEVGGDPVVIDFEVEFQGVDEGFVAFPSVGDRVYDSVRGHFLGYVTNVRYEPTTIFT